MQRTPAGLRRSSLYSTPSVYSTGSSVYSTGSSDSGYFSGSRIPKNDSANAPTRRIKHSDFGYTNNHPGAGRVRNPSTSEESTIREFLEHSKVCDFCRDPSVLNSAHGQLCTIGHRLAQDVDCFLYITPQGETWSWTDDCQIQLSHSTRSIINLLKAIERSRRRGTWTRPLKEAHPHPYSHLLTRKSASFVQEASDKRLQPSTGKPRSNSDSGYDGSNVEDDEKAAKCQPVGDAVGYEHVATDASTEDSDQEPISHQEEEIYGFESALTLDNLVDLHGPVKRRLAYRTRPAALHPVIREDDEDSFQQLYSSDEDSQAKWGETSPSLPGPFSEPARRLYLRHRGRNVYKAVGPGLSISEIFERHQTLTRTERKDAIKIEEGAQIEISKGEGEADSEDDEMETKLVDADMLLDTALVRIKKFLVQTLVDSATSEAQDGTDGSNSSHKRRRETSPSSESQRSLHPGQRKRMRGGGRDPGDGGDESDDDDGDDRPPKKPERQSPAGLPGRRLKCPFYQRSPEKYTRAACRGEGFGDMGKLKDHIKRVHTQPLRCLRCWKEMKSDDAYMEHLQREEICNKQPEPDDDRLRPQTLKRLDFKKAPYAHARDPEEKWKILYSVLFPGDKEIPSPYDQHILGARFEQVLYEAFEEQLTKELAPALEPVLRKMKELIPAIIQSCKTKLSGMSPDRDSESPQPSNDVLASSTDTLESPNTSRTASLYAEGPATNPVDIPSNNKGKAPQQSRFSPAGSSSTGSWQDSRHGSSPESIFDLNVRPIRPTALQSSSSFASGHSSDSMGLPVSPSISNKYLSVSLRTSESGSSMVVGPSPLSKLHVMNEPSRPNDHPIPVFTMHHSSDGQNNLALQNDFCAKQHSHSMEFVLGPNDATTAFNETTGTSHEKDLSTTSIAQCFPDDFDFELAEFFNIS